MIGTEIEQLEIEGLIERIPGVTPACWRITDKGLAILSGAVIFDGDRAVRIARRNNAVALARLNSAPGLVDFIRGSK